MKDTQDIIQPFDVQVQKNVRIDGVQNEWTNALNKWFSGGHMRESVCVCVCEVRSGNAGEAKTYHKQMNWIVVFIQRFELFNLDNFRLLFNVNLFK